MRRALSRDRRDRVVAAVEGGLSCRREVGVSAASAIRWRQLTRGHGAPAAKPQGGDRRSAKIEAHAATILGTIERQPDVMLEKLRAMLAEQDVSTSIAALWRFFARRGINRDAFLAQVDQVLVPELNPSDIVIMSNRSSHKAPVVHELIEAAGASLLYLPPYSPDLNPVEMV